VLRYAVREELTRRLEVFLFEVGKIAENLVLRHAGSEIGSEVVDGEAQAADAGLAAHLTGFDGDARIESWRQLDPSCGHSTPIAGCGRRGN
jgi:hypothetical protein